MSKLIEARIKNANKLFGAIILSFVLLIGCASMGTMTPAQKLETGCASAASALKAIVLINEVKPFSREDVAQVRKAVEVISPVCGAEEAPSLSVLETAVFEAAVEILKEKAK